MIPKVWAQADIQQAASDVDTLTQKLREYSAAGEAEKSALLEDLSAIAAAMDEGAMTEYLAMLTQIQSLLDSGLSESEIQGESEPGGIWSAKPFYIFPGSGSQTVFSITLDVYKRQLSSKPMLKTSYIKEMLNLKMMQNVLL